MPEVEEVPDFESRLTEEPKMGAWFRLLIIRTFRLDRAQLCIKSFIKEQPAMGQRYVEPVTDTAFYIRRDGADNPRHLSTVCWGRPNGGYYAAVQEEKVKLPCHWYG